MCPSSVRIFSSSSGGFFPLSTTVSSATSTASEISLRSLALLGTWGCRHTPATHPDWKTCAACRLPGTAEEPDDSRAARAAYCGCARRTRTVTTWRTFSAMPAEITRPIREAVIVFEAARIERTSGRPCPPASLGASYSNLINYDLLLTVHTPLMLLWKTNTMPRGRQYR